MATEDLAPPVSTVEQTTTDTVAATPAVGDDAPPAKAKAAAAKKPKVPRKPRSPSAHPTYLEMITEAITALKERTGSSQYAIAKFIEDKHKAKLPSNFKKLVLVQLKKLVAGGNLTKIKNSYKLSSVSKSRSAIPKKAKTGGATKKPAAKPKAKTAAKPKVKKAAAKPKVKAVAKTTKAKAAPAKAKPAPSKRKAAEKPKSDKSKAKVAKKSAKDTPSKKKVAPSKKALVKKAAPGKAKVAPVKKTVEKKAVLAKKGKALPVRKSKN